MVAVTQLLLGNRSQAVRIPANLRLLVSVKDVEVRARRREPELTPGTNRILVTMRGLSG